MNSRFMLMNGKKLIRWISNRLKYGVGDKGRERKLAAKKARREQKFESERWSKEDELAKRQYANYDQYIEHQSKCHACPRPLRYRYRPQPRAKQCLRATGWFPRHRIS